MNEIEALCKEIKEESYNSDKIQSLAFSQKENIRNTLSLILHQRFNIEILNLSQESIVKKEALKLSKEFSLKNNLIAFKRDEKGYYVAMRDPLNKSLKEEVKFFLKDNVTFCLSEEKEILKALHEVYIEDSEEVKNNNIENESELNIEKTMPMVEYSNDILERAILNGASDIHIEPINNMYRVRERINGILITKTKINIDIGNSLISRLKVQANMDISQKLLPQDGKISFHFKERVLDLRVSSIPCVSGEKVVIRILAKSDMLNIDSLGFQEEHNKKLKQCIKRQGGIILVTGPTGSGKSTTLYSLINEMDKEKLNVVTIEDPVEYKIEGISQIQINLKSGLGFPQILRSVLRQDPDVIMIGEIRDEETADIAFRAAITGHLVLSTLHTRDAVSSLSRLYNMNIPKYMVLESIELIIAQRLAKIKCSCKDKKDSLDRCSLCNDTGYKGRKVLYEFLEFNKENKDFIEKCSETSELRNHLKLCGFSTIEDNAMNLYERGYIDKDELSIYKS